ncbi:uncharacterized protein LOC134213624 [Armigeres subalbatus]|uniref:uncharacterized protein LOC134213624 n=1 Tax=Armigeres subalbatus TaxID=124917 RepID=UPI002ED3E5BF
MTPTRGKKLKTATSYTQRRRRLRHMASYASSMGSPKIPREESVTRPITSGHSSTPQQARDTNNNIAIINPNVRHYLTGAFIYKMVSEGKSDGDLRLHVFEQYEVKVRRNQLEPRTIESIASEFSAAATGKAMYVTSMYLAQRQVPKVCFQESLLELQRKAFWKINQKYRTSVDFQRKYVETIRHEYDPNAGGVFKYISTASLNVSGC